MLLLRSVLPLALLLPGCVSVTEGTWAFSEPIHTVSFALDHGDVTVTALPPGEGEGVAVVTIAHGGLGWDISPPSVEGGVLRIGLRCALATCGGSLEIAVPAHVDVEGDILYGDVFLEGLAGDVAVTVQAGALEAVDLRGTGGVSLVTGAGAVTAQWATRPTWVEAVTGAGAVALAVPPGAYDLDVDMGAGVVLLSAIEDDPRADATLYARAGSGEIRITGEAVSLSPGEGADRGGW